MLAAAQGGIVPPLLAPSFVKTTGRVKGVKTGTNNSWESNENSFHSTCDKCRRIAVFLAHIII